MSKTIAEINQKIKEGKVVVVTAEEMTSIVKERGVKSAARDIDVVTTGTFGPMCSSGMYINIGHSSPRIKLGGGVCFLNDVPAYTAFAAADLFIGSNSLPLDGPRNKVYPGKFKYGGGHLIEDFVRAKDIRLIASAYGTDCYPRRKLETLINIKDVNEAVLFNIRNCSQNYDVAVNLSDRVIYTYMGILKPHLGNANYCGAGALSPLLNDPLYKTIGIGTKVFLGGGIGFVSWWGTQHNPGVARTNKGIPMEPAGTLALIGDLKQMSGDWLVGTSMTGYGATLTVGVGIPVPILNEEMAAYAAVSDEDISAPVVDYSSDYPQRESKNLGYVNYSQLKMGKIAVKGKDIPVGSLSSYLKARRIAEILKGWIENAKFFLTEPVEKIPSSDSGYKLRPLKERNIS